MSAHQMVCHLNDAMHVMTGQRSTAPRGGLLQRTVVKWIALYLPFRWPPGIPTTPEVDQEAGGTRPTEFAHDVARLAEAVDRARPESIECGGRVHPIFGPMSNTAWFRWAYLHMDHHLRQFGV
jgi:hypothetical protein